MTKHDSVTIAETADLRSAMDSLRHSGAGLAVVVDEGNRVVGVVSDGDIRKALLEHEDMHRQISSCMNRDFVSVFADTPKEHTLKLMDSRIRAVPVIDEHGCFVDLVRPGYLAPRSSPFARARAPARLSLAGGGTDFTGYFMEHEGVCLSTTIAKFSHALLRKRDDRKVQIYSRDLLHSQLYENIDEVSYDGQLDLIKAGLKLMNPRYGFDLEIGCDFPPGSGLGGSASLLAAVIGCFNQFREDPLDPHSIAEHAFEAERLELNISGGWQDQYSTVFGGFNYIELSREQNIVTPLRLPQSILMELEERLLLCHTNIRHLGSAIQDDHAARDQSDVNWMANASDLKRLAAEMKSALLRGRLDGIGDMLAQSWDLKKAANANVTSVELDEIYDKACAAGAEGGRLLGTGGGGYFLFYLHPFRRYQVTKTLEQMGVSVESLLFDEEGLTTWMARP